MKTRNLRIAAMLASLVLGLVLVGAAKEWDYTGQSGYLSMSPSKLEAKPDDKPIKLLLSGMGKDGAFLEGDVQITGECGFINGVAAKTGGRAYLSGGVGSAIYRCDAKTETCCVGAQKFVAKLGSYEAGAAMSLRLDAKTAPEPTQPDGGSPLDGSLDVPDGSLDAPDGSLDTPDASGD